MNGWQIVQIVAVTIQVIAVCVQYYFIKQTEHYKNTCFEVRDHVFDLTQKNQDMIDDMDVKIENSKPKSLHLPSQEEIDEALNEDEN